MSQLRSRIESTFKSSDTEEFLDRIFYRPLGYAIAVCAKRLGITPNEITIFSIFIGVFAGHLFYYQSLYRNLLGIAFLIFAEALDSADGQLARLSGNHSKYGRILDGFGGNLWFLSIYLHLCLRYVVSGGTSWIFISAAAAAASHSLQSGAADYYRNFYLYFTSGGKKGELDESENLKSKYKKLRWSKDFPRKILMRAYINYTAEQEFFSVQTFSLYQFVKNSNRGQIPEWLAMAYRKLNKPLLKYGNILTTNTRMMVLFISILIRNSWLYFGFELTFMNILLVTTVYLHERNAKRLMHRLEMNLQESFASLHPISVDVQAAAKMGEPTVGSPGSELHFFKTMVPALSFPADVQKPRGIPSKDDGSVGVGDKPKGDS
jgi:hypothetical protein